MGSVIQYKNHQGFVLIYHYSFLLAPMAPFRQRAYSDASESGAEVAYLEILISLLCNCLVQSMIPRGMIR